jgi:hypothetical protein
LLFILFLFIINLYFNNFQTKLLNVTLRPWYRLENPKSGFEVPLARCDAHLSLASRRPLHYLLLGTDFQMGYYNCKYWGLQEACGTD